MRDETESEPSNDEKCIAQVRSSKLQIKEDVNFRLQADSVTETVTLSLLIWNPQTKKHDVYSIEKCVDLDAIYPEHSREVDAYLATEHDHALEGGAGDFDPSMFAPGAVASVLMDQASLLVESGGSEINIYLKIGAFEDMVSIERSIARYYVNFAGKNKVAS